MAEQPVKTLGQRSFAGVLWTFMALSTNQLLNIISMAVLARKLTPYEFGIIGATMLFVDFVNIINNFGVSACLIKRKELTKEYEYTAFTFSIATGVILYLLMFFISYPASEFFRIKELGPVLRVQSLIFIITSFYAVPKALLSRKMDFKYMAVNNTFSQIFGWTTVSIAMAYAGFGYWSIVGGRIANALFGSISILIKQPHSKKIKIDNQALKEITKFGSGISIQGILVYFAEQSDTVIIGRLMGASALGIYNRAYSLMAVFSNFLSLSLSGVLFSTTSRLNHDVKRISTAFEKLIKVSSIVLLPLITLILVLSPEIIRIVLGNQWNKSIILFQVLALGTFFRFGYTIGTSMLIAMGKLRQIIIRQIIYFLSVVSTVLIGIHYGLIGVAIAVFTCLLTNYLICSFQLMKLLMYPALSFLKAQLGGLQISFFVFLISYSSVYFLRNNLSTPYLITAICTCIVTGGALVIVYYIWPAFYGSENIRMLISLKDAILNKNKTNAVATGAVQKELYYDEERLPIIDK